MRYNKPALTFDQQAAQLILDRNMSGDPAQLRQRLENVSYYRLSAYWYEFRRPDETLRPGTSSNLVWRRYTFDRELRLLVLDAIERVEIAIRTRIVYDHSLKYGPMGYLNATQLPGIAYGVHLRWLSKLHQSTENSNETFVASFRQKYTAEPALPLWMVCELMTFGDMLTLYKGLEPQLRSSVSAHFGVTDEILRSWLTALNTVRNLGAHHARLWNRELGTQPAIPRRNKHPEWHAPVPIVAHRIFGVMTILRYLLNRTCPESRWQTRFEELLAEYDEIALADMGFPSDWQQSPLWKNPAR